MGVEDIKCKKNDLDWWGVFECVSAVLILILIYFFHLHFPGK